jgi:hypothetical protein
LPNNPAPIREHRRRLPERLRAEWVAGAEEEWRRRTGRPIILGALLHDAELAIHALDARVRAYEILGDRPRAVEIMERRLLAG